MKSSSFLFCCLINGLAFGQQNILVDHDLADEIISTNQGASYHHLNWKLNSNYHNNPSNNNRLTWALVGFDTLFDSNTLRSYQGTSGSFIIDSVGIKFNHQNITGTPDTIRVSVYPWQGLLGFAVNPMEEIVTPPLYDTMIVTTTSLSSGPSAITSLKVYPNLQLNSPNSKFSVGVHFYGDTTNSFSIQAGYSNGCGGSCYAMPSLFDLNSIWRIIAWGGTVEFTGINSIGHYPFCPGSCDQFELQNVSISAYLNINALSIATASSVDSCGGLPNGTVSVSVIGGSGNYNYQWSPVNGTDSFLTGLFPGVYQLTVTDSAASLFGYSSATVIGSCGTISGRVFEDLNKNGLTDVGESGLAGVTIEVNPGQIRAVTNGSGYYAVNVLSFDTFTVNVIPPRRFVCAFFFPDSITAPPSGDYSAIITPTQTLASGNDFGLSKFPPFCGTISGHVFDDTNNNGIKDVGEQGKRGVGVEDAFFLGVIRAVTDWFGNYTLGTLYGLPDTIELSRFCHAYCFSGYYFQTYPVTPPFYPVTLSQSFPASTGNDFGVHSPPYTDVEITNISPNGGNNAGMPFMAWVNLSSFGTLTDTCRFRLDFDSLVHFVSANHAPDVIGNSYLEWIYPGSSSYYHLALNFILDSSAVAGTQLTWNGTFVCDTPDNCPWNDAMTRVVEVISGPLKRQQDNGLNFIQVFPKGDQNNEITQADSVLSYVIYFQNTGSDTIYHFSIIDTLSPYVNLETISFPASSHPFQFHIAAPNVIIWELENILLPDSTTDRLHSYGFVQYNIKLKQDLPAGTVIKNSAELIFNYNYSHQTNETIVVLQTPSGLEKEEFRKSLKVAPNPGNGMFTLFYEDDKIEQLSVIDIHGKIIIETSLIEDTGKIPIDLSKHLNGLYLLRVRTDRQIWTGKLLLSK